MRIVRALAALALTATVLAGCSGARPTDGVESDTGSEAWRQLPDPPLSPRDHAVVVGVDGRMLVVGGWEFLCPPNADCSTPEEPLHADGAVYDPETDAWTTIAPAPFGVRRQEYAAAALDGSAYLLSGCRTGPVCGGRHRLLSYDLAANRWTDHGPVPAPGRYRHVVAAGDDLVAYSSSDERGEVPDVVFDPENQSWTVLPDDPLPRTYDRFIVAAGEQLVLAASPMGPESKMAARFDRGTGDWTRLEDAPGSGYQLFATDLGPMLNGHFIDEPGWLLDPETWTWSVLPRGGGDHAHLGGVLDRDNATYDVPNSVGQMTTRTQLLLFESGTESYVTVPPPPGREDVYDDSSAALGRDLFVFGGQRSGALVGDAWVWTAPS